MDNRHRRRASLVESTWPTLEPYPKAPLAPWLEGVSWRHGDRAALLDREGKGYSFREAFTLARRIGRLLQEGGLSKGDRVALLGPNSPFYIIASLGVFRAGGALLPLSPLYKDWEMKHFLTDTGARAALVSGDLLPRVQALKADLPELAELYVLEELEGRAGKVPPEPLPVEIDPEEDPSALFCTGGTTGLPKEAVHNHCDMIAALRHQMITRGANSLASWLVFTPLYLPFGLVGIGLGALSIGATQVVMPRFDPEEAMALIERHKVTYASMAPPALASLTEAATGRAIPLRGSPGPGGSGMTGNRYDLSSLKFVISGTMALSKELMERARQVLGCEVIQGIGTSETNSTNLNPPRRVKPGSVGPPVPDTQERIVDPDTGEDAGAGEVGELLVKGPQVFKGYWHNPQASAEALTPDGWFRTGDLVWADEEGYVYIVDRKKEIIKYKGYQVAPAELEGLLAEHPAVQEVAVIPKGDPQVGEIPKALIVLRAGAKVSPEELMAFVEEKVAPYKKVREVEFIEAMPRSAAGE
ncbi:MAG TPA: AMP-binding protein, partial [Dehalococcoidia bacterium]|nr:AMP-binding protein [Dehalococcoidia bacterium]